MSPEAYTLKGKIQRVRASGFSSRGVEGRSKRDPGGQRFRV